MRKVCIVVVVILILVQLLALPVYAADGDGLGSVISAIGGFFSDLIDTIVNLGEFLFEGFMEAMRFLLSGLKKLFIPRDDFFPRAADRLYNAFQAKFGGVLSLARYLKERFTNLRTYRGNLFVLQFPRGLFGGARVDLLAGAEGIANMIRTVLSGALILFTVGFAYKKVTAMINT